MQTVVFENGYLVVVVYRREVEWQGKPFPPEVVGKLNYCVEVKLFDVVPDVKTQKHLSQHTVGNGFGLKQQIGRNFRTVAVDFHLRVVGKTFQIGIVLRDVFRKASDVGRGVFVELAQKRNDFVAQKVACVLDLPVCGIVHVRHVVLLGVFHDVGTGIVQKRTQKLATLPLDAFHSVGAASSDEVHQYRFGVVVGMMRRADKVHFQRIKYPKTQQSCARFFRNFHCLTVRRHIYVESFALDAEFFAVICHKTAIGGSLFAQIVIYRYYKKLGAWIHCGKHVQHHHGIHSAGNGKGVRF